MKRFILAFIAAYVFLFFWGWLLNGVVLKDVYAETPNLWRSQSEMMSLFHWIIVGQALIVFAFVMIYASGFAGGGVAAGIRLGILLEIAAIGMRMGFYAVQPFPGKLIVYGSISGLTAHCSGSSNHLRHFMDRRANINAESVFTEMGERIKERIKKHSERSEDDNRRHRHADFV